jgi:hypothetical protein
MASTYAEQPTALLPLVQWSTCAVHVFDTAVIYVPGRMGTLEYDILISCVCYPANSESSRSGCHGNVA